MKIIRFEAENVKRIAVVGIDPDGSIVEVTGKNRNGKSSVLDAIWWALAGESAVDPKPIREGCEEARIFLDLGEYKVTRTFALSDRNAKGYTTRLIVENAEGTRASSPQALLDSLIGKLSFDPLDFERAKPAEQFEILKAFVPGVDFAGIARLNKSDYDKRTEVNRDEKRVRAQADAIKLPAFIPEEVDEADLIRELEEAGEHNAGVERRKARREAVANEIAQIEARLDELRALRDGADPLPDPIDTAALRDRIADAKETNDIARRAEFKRGLVADADRLKAESEALTQAMADREAQKSAAIAAAEIPVDGIEFGDGIVLLNGVPFEQGSDAERLRAAIQIAAAMNPKLKIIRVRDGSRLDTDSFALLADMAEQMDAQVWVETVQSGRATAIVIEDGRVSAAG